MERPIAKPDGKLDAGVHFNGKRLAGGFQLPGIGQRVVIGDRECGEPRESGKLRQLLQRKKSVAAQTVAVGVDEEFGHAFAATRNLSIAIATSGSRSRAPNATTAAACGRR